MLRRLATKTFSSKLREVEATVTRFVHNAQCRRCRSKSAFSIEKLTGIWKKLGPFPIKVDKICNLDVKKRIIFDISFMLIANFEQSWMKLENLVISHILLNYGKYSLTAYKARSFKNPNFYLNYCRPYKVFWLHKPFFTKKKFKKCWNAHLD